MISLLSNKSPKRGIDFDQPFADNRPAGIKYIKDIKVPEQPRISVHDYVDARLDEQDERIKLALNESASREELSNQKVLIEAKETRAWFLFLSAPSWAAFIQDWANHDIATTFAVIAFVLGIIGIAFYRTRKPVIQNARS